MSGDLKLIGKMEKTAAKLLIDVASVLDDEKIKYVLDYGTLLGIVRENRFLPWDTDMDISITEEFEKQLLKIRWKLWLKGYRTRIRRFKRDVGSFKKGEIRIIKVQTRRLLFFRKNRLLDVFIKKNVGGKYCYVVGNEPAVCKSVPLKYHQKTTRIKFKDHLFSVPEDYHEYLEYVYGDWRVPVKEWSSMTSDNCVDNIID